jgi:hypothetical protein
VITKNQILEWKSAVDERVAGFSPSQPEYQPNF